MNLLIRFLLFSVHKSFLQIIKKFSLRAQVAFLAHIIIRFAGRKHFPLHTKWFSRIFQGPYVLWNRSVAIKRWITSEAWNYINCIIVTAPEMLSALENFFLLKFQNLYIYIYIYYIYIYYIYYNIYYIYVYYQGARTRDTRERTSKKGVRTREIGAGNGKIKLKWENNKNIES